MISDLDLVATSAAPDLIAALRVVEDCSVAGRPRFSAQLQRRLQRAILTRSGGQALVELVYFAAFAATCDARGRYEPLLWGVNPADATGYRSACGRTAAPSVAEAQVTVTTRDGSFGIAYARMPYLAALAEFLVTVLGYDAFDAALAPVVGPPLTHRAVADVANALGRALNAWLTSRLASSHAQRRIRMMCARLNDAALDDELILQSWCDWSVLDNAGEDGTKSYRNVFDGFMQVQRSAAIAADSRQLAVAEVIGTDAETGEVDPDDDAALLDMTDEEPEILARFDQGPLDTVKFLFGREREALDVLAAVGHGARSFAWSLCRRQVWGDVQSRITEAQRRRQRLDSTPQTDYTAALTQFARIADHVDRLCWATLHVLIEERLGDALALLFQLRPDASFVQAAKPLAEGVRSLPAISPAERFVILLRSDPAALGPDAVAIRAAARAAFKAIARKGFDDGPPSAPVVAAFVAAAQTLPAVRRIAGRGRTLAGNRRNWVEMMTGDSAIFPLQFTRIYGEAS